MKLNVVQMTRPDRKYHPIQGYQEVVETTLWGLQQLGHDVTYTLNTVTTDRRNIIFAAHFIAQAHHAQLPPDTILYNLEPLRNAKSADIDATIKSLAARFQIWDYTPFNVAAWNEMPLRTPIKVVPIGYAPLLERVPRGPALEIDALIYGSSNELRLSVFDGMARAGLRSVFLAGLYGPTRDALIARSRTVLNINNFASAKIFEVVRVSYLMANRKAVVALIDPDIVIEPDIRDGVALATATSIVDEVTAIATDDARRQALEERGYEIFKKRDVRQYLAAALG